MNPTKYININITFLLILFIFLFGGCGDSTPKVPSSYPVKTIVENGVTRVENPNYPKTLIQNVQIEEVLSIDNPEDEESMIARANQLRVDNAGNIYVLDYKMRRIVVFDSQGTFVRSMARKGIGPGELYLPAKHIVNEKHGTLDILDARNDKIVRYNLDGTFKEEIKLNSHSSQNFYIDSDGNYIVEFSDITKNSNQVIRLVKYSPTGDIVSRSGDFVEFKVKAMSKGQFTMVGASPFDPNGVFLCSSKGNLFYTFSGTYRISLLDKNFEVKKVFEKKNPLHVKIPEKLKNRYVAYLKNRIESKGKPFEKSFLKLPTFFPAFKAVWTDDQQRIIVRAYSTDKKAHLDIFDQSGIYIQSVIIPPPVNGIAIKHIFDEPVFKEGFIYSIVQDEDGEIFIKKYRLQTIKH